MSKLRTTVNNRKAPTRWKMVTIQLLRTLLEDFVHSRRLFQGFPWFCFWIESWKKNITYTFLFIQSVNEYNLKLMALKRLYTPKGTNKMNDADDSVVTYITWRLDVFSKALSGIFLILFPKRNLKKKKTM